VLSPGTRSCLALCSDSPMAVVPKSDVRYSRSYRLDPGGPWLPIPEAVRGPHHLGRTRTASAFVVASIRPIPAQHRELDGRAMWLAKSGSWRTDRVPTRGEYLLRPASEGAELRRVYAVLELRYPYVAWLSAD